MTWEPLWALPNIDLDEPVNSETFALVSSADARVQELVRQHSNFETFLNQFQDTHNNRIIPTLIIRRTDVPEPLNLSDAAASFRDLIVATVPIRLSPIPTTSRVLPIPRVKLGLGRAAISPAISSAS